MDITSGKQGSSDHGTRRNTRSTSNQDREKENADNGKNQSSSGNANKDCETGTSDTSKKRQSERVIRAANGDVLEYTTEDDVTYRPMDSAYLATERPDNPYFICTIQEIKVSKRDNAIVAVKWYYRPTEVPDLVYQMLVKDRYNQVDDLKVKELIMKPDVANRELFISDLETTDTYPISCLRGKCEISQYGSISEIKNFELRPDHFFFILSYNPETRRLASASGETTVGPSHQWNASMRGIFQKAELPDVMPLSERGYEKHRVYEEMTWEPKVNKCDLIMCLRAARSLAAFAGVCDGVSPEEGCIVASRDDTTINALRVLYENNGNPRKAIDALVKNPVPITIESKWTEEQVKRFQRGLRLHGKNFFRIKKELLPMKETGELVEFYYLWKKTQDSLMIRPHHRKHRRQAALKKSGKPKNGTTGSGDQTSTEEETEESEESEKETNNYKCKHCLTSNSKDWKLGGKDGLMLCTDCRIFYKKYGENRPVIKVEDIDSANETDIDTPPAAKSQLPPFLYKPIKEEKLNNLIPRKPAKSLAKVNSTAESKNPSKRQWSDSEETKVKHEDVSTDLKRPKTEPDQVDDDTQDNQSNVPRSSPSPLISSGGNVKGSPAFIDCKPFSPPHTCSLPPSIIPGKKIHPSFVSVSASHSIGKSIIPGQTELSSSLPSGPPHLYKLSSSSAGLSPFVSTAQSQALISGKSTEIENMSKMALNTGAISRNIYPTVGYMGAGTPPITQTQVPTSAAPASAYSLSATTTVTMTSTVRSSPTVDHPRNSEPNNVPRPPENTTTVGGLESSSRPRMQAPHRSSDYPSHSGRISPPSRPVDDKSNLAYYVPRHPAPMKKSRFPFDPYVTDQIISNANMPRMAIKEEPTRTVSPSSSQSHQLSVPHHAVPTRASPIPQHIKQEPHHTISDHPQQVHHKPGAIYPQTRHPGPPPIQGAVPHGSRPPLSVPRHPGHPSLSHHHGASRPQAAISPRPRTTSYPGQHHSAQGSQPQDDSDVELIGEQRIKSPPPVRVEEIIHHGSSARFCKIWNRGPNSCFRTDYIFNPDKISMEKQRQGQLEFRKKEQSQQQQQQSAPPPQPHDPMRHPPHKRPRTPPHSHPHSDHDRKREEKNESLDRSRREGPGPLSSSSLPPQAHRSTPSHSNVPRSTPTRTPTSASYEQHHRPPPAPFMSPLGADTPALRQLQQYSNNLQQIGMRRQAAEAMSSMHHLHPYYSSLAAAGAENDMRERERLAKLDVKPEMMMDPHNPNMHQIPLSAIPGLHVGGIPVSLAGQHLVSVEQQLQLRQYQAQLLNSLPQGPNPHQLAVAAAAGLPPGAIAHHFNPEAYTAERLSAERLQAERLAAVQQYELDLLHHHQHQHVHSHLHLHQPGQPGGPPPPGTPLPLGGLPPQPHGIPVEQLMNNPYAQAAAVAMQSMHPFAAGSGNPMLLNPALQAAQTQQAAVAAAQASLIQQGMPGVAAAAHLHAAVVGREQAGQPHVLSASQHLQAVNEQHMLESTQQHARALQAFQERQYMARLAGHKP
ncbi:uncharacterized protein LOC120328902 isoform X1 [Styela clava]